MSQSQVHPFQRAGLGKAPFRYIGMAAQDICYGQAILNRAEYERTGVAVTTKPGGTCAYCGRYIVNMFNIESADGKRFHVGCDCVEKTGDVKLVKAVDAATRKLAKARREATAERVRTELRALLADGGVRAKLATIPDPNRGSWRGAEDRTLLTWADFMLARAGATGRAKALKAVKAALED